MDFDIGGQQGAEGGFLGNVVKRNVADSGLTGLGGQFFDVAGGGESDDLDLFWQFAGHLERGAADGSRGA